MFWLNGLSCLNLDDPKITLLAHVRLAPTGAGGWVLKPDSDANKNILKAFFFIQGTLKAVGGYGSKNIIWSYGWTS